MSDREFILFIPGMGAEEPEIYLNKLIEGIRHYCDRNALSFEELDDSEGEVGGTGQRRIKVILGDNKTKVIDIQEVYWGDFRTFLSHESGIIQVLRGFSLLLFWLASAKLWKQISSSKYILFWMIATLIVSIGWYYGVLATAFTAIGTNPEVFNFKLPPEIATFFKQLGTTMGSWYAWIVTSILISIFPVKKIIDISYSTKCYLKNYKGTYNKIYSRVNKTLKAVTQLSQNNEIAKPNYNSITVLSHSFGSIVSTELLAKYEGQIPIRNITLGGALLIITARSTRVKDALTNVLVNNKIVSWIDFYSYSDWLCTKSPVSSDEKKFQGHRIKTTVEFDEKFNGTSHDLYFDDDDVIRTLLQ